jgi:predicted  nucleic acid-binding Zn-ribbon protein
MNSHKHLTNYGNLGLNNQIKLDSGKIIRIFEMEALAQELSKLKAEAVVLKEQIRDQPDRDALQIALAAKEGRIAALENRITELQNSSGNFSFSLC